jgi:NADH:ubiquinone oxidoreductase subunit 2 (chain N)
MTVFLFSMAGLPVGGGFLSKLYLLVAAVNGGVVVLAVALVGNSVVSVFYYTRLVRAMWAEEPDGEIETSRSPVGLYAALVIALLGTVLLLPGFGLVVDAAGAAAETVGA